MLKEYEQKWNQGGNLVQLLLFNMFVTTAKDYTDPCQSICRVKLSLTCY